MDFFQVCERPIMSGPDKGCIEVFPNFIVGRTTDIMIRGKSFYAIWDEDAGMWSTDEYDVQRLVDKELDEYVKDKDKNLYKVKHLSSFSNNYWKNFKTYIQNLGDNYQQLDQQLTFHNTEVKKSDYRSKRLGYSLVPGGCASWDELVGTLYSPEERAKIEWAIGSIVAGDSKRIQKFLVLYGPAGTGKSTILNIVLDLFEGYTTSFDAKALGSSGGTFATEAFKRDPLVAIQQDGDLSKIEDNTRLNSIISHEVMSMNEKHKALYEARVNAFIMMGTNQPVKISDAKSGIIRRLIDVHPTGTLLSPNHYTSLMTQIGFELGAIAHHCLEVYRSMGKNYYNTYRPLEMMFQTDVFFNFIEAHYDIFKEQDFVSLRQAYDLYKEYCGSTGIDRPIPQYKVREELRNYFDEFHERFEHNGEVMRSVFSGFSAKKFKSESTTDVEFKLVVDQSTSILDDILSGQPAQLSKADDFGDRIPAKAWDKVTTTLRDVATDELHFVKLPRNHIVIDFDLTDELGEKDLERNLRAASQWPATYAELSKSGKGVHLHYYTDLDVETLAKEISPGIECKTLLGNASLRRRLSKCNDVPIATINSGLPFKEKKVLSEQTIKSEQGLRTLVQRNLAKEIHPDTRSSIDFIKKILDDAHESGLAYDLTDMRGQIVAFANNSSNQPLQCLKAVQQMKFMGEGTVEVLEEPGVETPTPVSAKDERIVHYDIEVYPNLFVLCWKFDGADDIVRMVNPSANDVQTVLKLKLVGFNNRRYDNHILYAASMGYTNSQLYDLSQRLINNDKNSTFASAYNLSYADIYEFSSKKQSLKRFQIELGLHHQEMDLPWDEYVSPENVERVVEYCCNDVRTQEAVFHARKQDFVARQILASLSGLSVNDTTQKHTGKIIFGNDKAPQRQFIYTDLSKEFPGYEFDRGKSTYRGEDPSEGGYVYSEPGMYESVAVLDVASMHPTSIIKLNLFGDEYTPRFKQLLDARLAIKHGDYEAAGGMLDGKLKPYLGDPKDAGALSDALKIVINIVYGLTSAKFDNLFRDVRNKDNIVAKRGALFMIDLKHYVQEELGLQVVHIKTDSIKVPNATPEQIEAIQRFGEKYGYTFEHEATYEKFCLVNDAVYIARETIPAEVGGNNKDAWKTKWDAVGAQFAHPFVYKTLFTMEDITFDDMCETKQTQQGAMYLDTEYDRPMALVEAMTFIGKSGQFVPVLGEGKAGILYRVKDGKKYAVTGTKGHLWIEAEVAREMYEADALDIDMSYFDKLVDEAKRNIERFGSFEEFVR